jgi:ankyrin repeat protein
MNAEVRQQYLQYLRNNPQIVNTTNPQGLNPIQFHLWELDQKYYDNEEIRNFTFDAIKILVENGSNPDIINSALSFALCDFEILAYLIDEGGNVNKIINNNGNTLVHEILNQPFNDRILLPFIDFLIGHGADFFAKNIRGKTPLDLASPYIYSYITEKLGQGSEKPLPTKRYKYADSNKNDYDSDATEYEETLPLRKKRSRPVSTPKKPSGLYKAAPTTRSFITMYDKGYAEVDEWGNIERVYGDEE